MENYPPVGKQSSKLQIWFFSPKHSQTNLSCRRKRIWVQQRPRRLRGLWRRTERRFWRWREWKGSQKTFQESHRGQEIQVWPMWQDLPQLPSSLHTLQAQALVWREAQPSKSDRKRERTTPKECKPEWITYRNKLIQRVKNTFRQMREQEMESIPYMGSCLWLEPISEINIPIPTTIPCISS